jgi:hypothetical protein
MRGWREYRGLRLDELAMLAGTSESVISDYDMQFRLMPALQIDRRKFFDPPEWLGDNTGEIVGRLEAVRKW